MSANRKLHSCRLTPASMVRVTMLHLQFAHKRCKRDANAEKQLLSDKVAETLTREQGFKFPAARTTWISSRLTKSLSQVHPLTQTRREIHV